MNSPGPTPWQTAAALEGCDAVIGGQFMRNSVEVAEKLGGSLKLMMMTRTLMKVCVAIRMR